MTELPVSRGGAERLGLVQQRRRLRQEVQDEWVLKAEKALGGEMICGYECPILFSESFLACACHVSLQATCLLGIGTGLGLIPSPRAVNTAP